MTKKKEKDIKKEKCECIDNCNCGDECKCEESKCDDNCSCNCDEVNIEELIEKLENEKKELTEKVMLAQAELINYRKRKDEEISNFKKFCHQDIITDLIPIIDNFERAINLDDNNLDDELSKFLAGFKMMYASLTEVLKRYGVEEISRQGEVFDANLEEALMTDNLEEYDDDVVTEVLLKGYKLHDRVIRPASVKINKKN